MVSGFTLSERFARACVPPRTLVFGFRLQPLTVGHIVLLTAIGSPWGWRGSAEIETDEAPTIGELLLVVWIIARPWREAEREINGLRMRWQLRIKARAARWFPRHLNKAIFVLNRYFTSAWRSPEFWEDKSKAGAKSALPGLLALLLALVKHYHLTPSEVWDMQLSQALWMMAVLAEHENPGKMISDTEFALMAAMKGEAKRV